MSQPNLRRSIILFTNFWSHAAAAIVPARRGRLSHALIEPAPRQAGSSFSQGACHIGKPRICCSLSFEIFD